MLTEKYRPKELSDMVGQENLTGQNGILTRMLDNKTLQSCIFFGPPGIGKTTAAEIVAEKSNMPFYKLNATNCSVKDIQAIIAEEKKKAWPRQVVLYLDEIQNFNRKQQQSLLPYTESGELILIASTADNPYHCVYDALRSRCVMCKFKPVKPNDIAFVIRKVLVSENDLRLDDEAIEFLAEISTGDIRNAVKTLELCLNTIPKPDPITKEAIKNIIPKEQIGRFDMDQDVHYALISALQKSIRGSDPQAAVFYLTRLLDAGDLESPARRLPVIACEDIGLANPYAIVHTISCIEAAERIGFPECYKPMVQAVIYLAMSVKSNSNEPSYYGALDDIHAGKGQEVPNHLRNMCAPGYIYPHDFPYHWCSQQYLPTDIKDHVYYKPGNNTAERDAYNVQASIGNVIDKGDGIYQYNNL